MTHLAERDDYHELQSHPIPRFSRRSHPSPFPAMSDNPAPKSHATTWMVSVVAGLFLYAATWPMVDIKTTTAIFLNSGPYRLPPRQPNWVRMMYRPMFWLSSLNDWRNPVAQYHSWWRARLQERIIYVDDFWKVPK